MLWVAGAIADGGARLLLWGLAVVPAYGGGWVQHWLPWRGRRVDLEHTQIAGGHLVERFRLLFIVVLGETVLRMGNAVAGEPYELERLIALAVGFAGTVALWWCYFQRAEPRGAQAAETAEDAGAVALWATWTLTLIVLALIAIAVADELTIAHPGDDATLGFTILAFGGPALFLLAQLLFQHAALGRAPRSRALGLAALAIPRGCHRAADADRRDRCGQRRAHRGRGQRHGARRRSGAKQLGVAVRGQQAAGADPERPAASASPSPALFAAAAAEVLID